MNPAAELRQRAQEKWPGAIVIERGRNSITHRHPTQPNRIMVDSTLGAIHFAGNQEIDTAWVPDTGAWQRKMEFAEFNAYARDVLNAGPVVEYRDPSSGEWINFQPLALNWVNQDDSRQQLALPQAVTASVNDDTLIWQDGYGTGRHFRYQAQTERLQKLFIIDTPSAIPATEPWMVGTVDIEVEFIIAYSANVNAFIDGVEWDKTTKVATGNYIEFRDTLGETRWFLGVPTASDSVGAVVVGQYQLRKQANSFYITVRIPKTWVDTAVFPIEIDPTVTPLIGASADDAFCSTPGGVASLTATQIYVGNGAELNPPSRHSGWRFQLTGPVSGNTIDLAYVEGVRNGGGSTGTLPVRFSADDVDNGGAWVGTDSIYNQLTAQTTAMVAYKTSVSYSDTTHQRLADPNQDIKSVIQEIVDRPGWNSGNYIRIIIEGYNADTTFQALPFASYDASTTLCGRLHVEYSTGAIIEESVTLNRVLSCTQPIAGTNETASANRVLTVTASETLQASDDSSANRVLAVTATETTEVGDGTTQNRVLAIQVQAGKIVEETVTIARFLGISQLSNPAYDEAVSIGKIAGISATQYATIEETAAINRILTSAPASLSEVYDSVTLDRLIQIFVNSGAGTIEEAVSIAKSVGASVAALGEFGEAVSLGRVDGITIDERLAKFDESVLIAKYIGVTASPESGPVEENVIISRSLGVDAAGQLLANETISLSKFLAASVGSLVEVNGTLVLVRAEGIYPLSQAETNEAISIEKYLATLASVGHKVVPVRFIGVVGRDDTFAAESRRVIIVPPRRDINVD